MWLSTWPDINTPVNMDNFDIGWKNSVDKPYVEQVKAWESNFKKAIWDINSKLALNWKKLELPKTIEEKEKEIYNIVWNINLKEARENWDFTGNINIRYIDRDVFAIQSDETKNISLFVNEKWKDLMLLWHRQDILTDDKTWELFPSSIKAMKEVWYYCDFKDWKRDLYKILWEWKNWNFILDDIPLDIFSKEYYLVWKKIIKTDDTLSILLALKEWWKRNINAIDNYSNSWTLTLKFLLLFQDKWLLEKPELFEYWISKMWIKESDVRSAFEKWEITEQEALKIYQVLPKEKKDINK